VIVFAGIQAAFVASAEEVEGIWPNSMNPAPTSLLPHPRPHFATEIHDERNLHLIAGS